MRILAAAHGDGTRVAGDAGRAGRRRPPAVPADHVRRRPRGRERRRRADRSAAPDAGYFNLFDYSHDAFNVLTMSFSAEIRATDRIGVRRPDHSTRSRCAAASPDPSDRHVVYPYALYLRVRRRRSRPFTVLAGRIPPVFGAFARRDYGEVEPADRPAARLRLLDDDAARSRRPSRRELLLNRGGGWAVRYPRATAAVGPQGAAAGLGAALGHRRLGAVGWRARSTPASPSRSGTLSSPRTDDDNDGKQISGRVGFTPTASFSVGVSAAGGEYLADPGGPTDYGDGRLAAAAGELRDPSPAGARPGRRVPARARRRARRGGGEPLGRAVPERRPDAGARRPRHLARDARRADPALVDGGARRSARLLARGHGERRRPQLGRQRPPRRGGRRLPGAPQRAAQGRLSVQLARRRPRAVASAWPARSSSTGSDDDTLPPSARRSRRLRLSLAAASLGLVGPRRRGRSRPARSAAR